MSAKHYRKVVLDFGHIELQPKDFERLRGIRQAHQRFGGHTKVRRKGNVLTCEVTAPTQSVVEAAKHALNSLTNTREAAREFASQFFDKLGGFGR